MKTMVSSITLEFEPLTLTTKHPFGISYGTSKQTHNILVKLNYQGLVGLGECAPRTWNPSGSAGVIVQDDRLARSGAAGKLSHPNGQGPQAISAMNRQTH